jgi:hypothetical protein
MAAISIMNCCCRRCNDEAMVISVKLMGWAERRVCGGFGKADLVIDCRGFDSQW